MSIYGKAAVRAKHLVLRAGRAPKAAWESAVAEFTTSPSVRKKCCPKGAFLGLCEAGAIAGIPAGRYAAPASNKNGEYALIAWLELQSEPKLGTAAGALWNQVTKRMADPPKNHNSQMDLVLGLWSDQPAGTP